MGEVILKFASVGDLNDFLQSHKKIVDEDCQEEELEYLRGQLNWMKEDRGYLQDQVNTLTHERDRYKDALIANGLMAEPIDK